MEKLLAKSGPDWTTLEDHIYQVAIAAKLFAANKGMDENLAFRGAILHDIGKAHHEFQKRLKSNLRSAKVFRHEIASLFFISLFPKDEHAALIEMVVGHHKSIKKDVGEKGLLDLDSNEDYEQYHLGKWNEWSLQANELLNHFGIETKIISVKEKS